MAEGQNQSLEALLEYTFQDPALLKLALTHPSYARDQNDSNTHYERLEFLGDSVLSLVLAEALHNTYPNEPEGRLAAARSALGRGQELSQLAKSLGIGPHILIGKGTGTRDSKGNVRPSILENALEAIVGAIFLDSGFPAARACILKWYTPLPNDISKLLGDLNPKGKLQEHYQSLDEAPEIVYDLLDESGPDHAKSYHIEVRIGDAPAGKGSGTSKKEAEENAAREALKKAKA